MSGLLDVFVKGYASANGYQLASALDPSHVTRLQRFCSKTHEDAATDARYATIYNKDLAWSRAESQAWLDVLMAVYHAGRALLGRDPGRPRIMSDIYAQWKSVLVAIISGYTKGLFAAWTIPTMYVTSKWLRDFAIKADVQDAKHKGGARFAKDANALDDATVEESTGQEWLEDAGRNISKLFGLCISDRAPLEDSRKWGLYYIANLLFKTYFKLNQVNLCKNILRSLDVSNADMPPLAAFPKSHIVTFRYYSGAVAFLEEDYPKAEEHLTAALAMTHARLVPRNRQLILTYLIPTRLLTRHLLPTPALLAPYAPLQRLFGPLAACIKRGDLAGFDAALEAGYGEFVKRRIYLTLERARDVCLRNLFRRVYRAGEAEGAGGARRTRIPIEEFEAAMRLSLRGPAPDSEGTGPAEPDVHVWRDEVECLIANLIYKGLVKGYISREHGKVVLSKTEAFPGTGM